MYKNGIMNSNNYLKVESLVGFTAEFCQTCKGQTATVLKLLQITERRKTLPNSLYKAIIILIQNPVIIQQQQKTYRTTLMSLAAKIVNKY
jgi:hypothetical protein